MLVARQDVDEIHAAWAFDARQRRLASREQLRGEGWARRIARLELHHGFHLLPEIGVRDTDYRQVGHGRMGRQNVFGLLRINVHAT